MLLSIRDCIVYKYKCIKYLVYKYLFFEKNLC